jgi:hypothetical protein
MREIPILFSASMVRALLSGSKNQTRRIVKGNIDKFDFLSIGNLEVEGKQKGYCAIFRAPKDDWIAEDKPWHEYIKSPYGQPGDQLRVKEAAWMRCEKRPNGKTKTGRDKWHFVPLESAPVFYAADHPKRPALDVVSPLTGNQWVWRLKIGRFMPRWASRITLEIIGIRVERLNDCSEQDAIAEGIERVGGFASVSPWRNYRKGEEGEMLLHCSAPTRSYMTLWESINGAGSWAANPWVWVVEFKVVKP